MHILHTIEHVYSNLYSRIRVEIATRQMYLSEAKIRDNRIVFYAFKALLRGTDRANREQPLPQFSDPWNNHCRSACLRRLRCGDALTTSAPLQ